MCTRIIGLPGGAEGVRQIELRHHDALEGIGRLADDDGVDVLPRHVGVVEGALGRLPKQAGL